MTARDVAAGGQGELPNQNGTVGGGWRLADGG